MLPKFRTCRGKRYQRYRNVFSNEKEARKKADELKKGNYTMVKKLKRDNGEEVWALFYRTK